MPRPMLSFSEGRKLEKMKISNSTIQGKQSVGGIIGSSGSYAASNMIVEKCEITGEIAVGGYAGSAGHGETKEDIYIINSNIRGIKL